MILVFEMTKINVIFQVFAEMARAEMIEDELLQADHTVRFWTILLLFSLKKSKLKINAYSD